jgi:hypothetical protein
MSAMFAGIAFTVVFSIPALVREIRLARRFDRTPAMRGPGLQLASRLLRRNRSRHVRQSCWGSSARQMGRHR